MYYLPWQSLFVFVARRLLCTVDTYFHAVLGKHFSGWRLKKKKCEEIIYISSCSCHSNFISQSTNGWKYDTCRHLSWFLIGQGTLLELIFVIWEALLIEKVSSACTSFIFNTIFTQPLCSSVAFETCWGLLKEASIQSRLKHNWS